MKITTLGKWFVLQVVVTGKDTSLTLLFHKLLLCNVSEILGILLELGWKTWWRDEAWTADQPSWCRYMLRGLLQHNFMKVLCKLLYVEAWVTHICSEWLVSHDTFQYVSIVSLTRKQAGQKKPGKDRKMTVNWRWIPSKVCNSVRDEEETETVTNNRNNRINNLIQVCFAC